MYIKIAIEERTPSMVAGRVDAIWHKEVLRMSNTNRILPRAVNLRSACAAAFLAAATLGVASSALAEDAADKALIILSSESQQTRGMAMVLGNAMMDKGASVRVLLCDSAGDMAVEGYESEKLAPRDVTPEQMLGRLMANDSQVEVCALYLPNSDYEEEDLKDGVGVAQPPAIAGEMLSPDVRVFSF